VSRNGEKQIEEEKENVYADQLQKVRWRWLQRGAP